MELNLSPDVEAGLLAQAQAHGLSLEDYLHQVLHAAAGFYVERHR